MVCPNPVTRYLRMNAVSGKWETLSKEPGDGKPYRVVTHPCGHCFACRVNHSKQWAARLVHEYQTSETGFFLNLTVNDDYLPVLFTPVPATQRQLQSVLKSRKGRGYNASSGFSLDVLKTRTVYSLSHRPIQLFIKRLRKAYPDAKVRYFCAGEYGPTNLRPHYHLIVYGFRPTDLVPHSVRGKNVLFRSPTIERLWSDPASGASYGFSLIGTVTPQSCQYVAQYCIKKQKGSVNGAEYYGETFPPYIRMSQGIGRSFLASYWPELYNTGSVVLTGQRFCGIPRYYHKLMSKLHPKELHAFRLSQMKEVIELAQPAEHYYDDGVAAARKAAKTILRADVSESDVERYVARHSVHYSRGFTDHGMPVSEKRRYLAHLELTRQSEAERVMLVRSELYEQSERRTLL